MPTFRDGQCQEWNTATAQFIPSELFSREGLAARLGARNANEWSSFAAAVTALSPLGAQTLDVTTQQTLTAAVDVPRNISLRVYGQGSFTSATALNLTIRGGLQAAPTQIFFGSVNAKLAARAAAAILPQWFGVQFDAELYADGAANVATPTTFTSALRPATSADIGKSIVIYGAGAFSSYAGFNNPLRTTVANVSGGAFVLAAGVSATVSGARFVLGTNDASAMQKAANSIIEKGTIEVCGSSMIGAVTLQSYTTIRSRPYNSMFYSVSSQVFTFDGKRNITIDGVSIDACGNPSSGGSITMIGGTTVRDVRVTQCELLDTFLLNNGNSVPVGTFNRHGVLVRDCVNVWIIGNSFGPAMRIKAAGTGNSTNIDIGFNYFDRTNENGISLLNNAVAGVVDGVNIHDNVLRGVIDSGNQITIGDDGSGGVTQTMKNIRVVNNLLVGPLPNGTAHIQNKVNPIQANVDISHNTFDNSTAVSAGSATMAINSAVQTDNGQPVVNFTCIGNQARGFYDYAIYRIGSIASGTVRGNLGQSLNGGRGLRMGQISNILISGNVITGTGAGLYLNNGQVTNAVVEDNNINLAAQDGAVGIYLESFTQAITLRLERNTINGAGGSWHNVYGILDESNGNGNTDAVEFIENRITNINTTTGLGSRYYQQLPTHAILIEPKAQATATVTNNSATPSVRGLRALVVSNTSATTITDLQNGSASQVLTLMFTNGNTTVQNNANIKLKPRITSVDTTTGNPNYTTPDFVGAADKTLTLIWTGSAWDEV